MSEPNASAKEPRPPYAYKLQQPKDLDDLPEHVQTLVATILRVDYSVLKDFEQEFQECEPEYTCSEKCQVQPCRELKHRLKKLLHNDMDWDPLFSKKRLLDETKEHLKRLHERVNATQTKAYDFRAEKEAPWEALYSSEFFERLQKETTSKTREWFYNGQFEIQRKSHWTIFRPKDRWKWKQPNPDISFHFKLHRENESMTCVPCHATDRIVVRNFSRHTLLHLAEVAGLEPSPFRHFTNARTPGSGNDAQCVCGYPWFICEFKGSQGSLREVADQAARAAHCSLQMYANLFAYGEEMRASGRFADPDETPPIVTMTTVGSRVHVWVAWQCIADPDNPEEDQSLMQCVWEGDMLVAQDIIRLQVILENTYSWVKNTLRPKISSCIDNWLKWYKPGLSPASKPSAHRTTSDPTPLPRTPKAARNTISDVDDLVTQSQPGGGKKAAASSRATLFPIASTSKVNIRAKSLDDSPSIRVDDKDSRKRVSKSAETTTPLVSNSKQTTSPPRASVRYRKSHTLVQLISLTTDSEYEETDGDEEQEQEDEDEDEDEDGEFVSQDSDESESSVESFDDAASFDSHEAPDQAQTSFETLTPSTPCEEKQRRRSPRLNVGSRVRIEDDEADYEKQSPRSILKTRGRRSLG